MKAVNVHKGLMSTWEMTFKEEKRKLKRNRHEIILAWRIMKCRSVLNDHVNELSWHGGRGHLTKKFHLYKDNVVMLNHLLRDYAIWYNRTQK